jgi:hypothetical protein
MPVNRMAGQAAQKIVRAIPGLGDFLGAAAELVNPEEPNAAQRTANALIVGGGGLGVSAVTGGLDAVPQMIDLISEYTGIKGPEKLQQMQKCMRAVNPDRHLREVAYSAKGGAGYWGDNFTKDIQACQAYTTPGAAIRPTSYLMRGIPGRF